MPRRAISLLPLLPLLLLLPACHHHHSAHTPIIPIPPATIALPLLNPEPLTPDQLEQIQSLLQSHFPKSPPIWFILILDNTTAESPHTSVIVYFIPDKQTTINGPDLLADPFPILRQGRCVTLTTTDNPPAISDIQTYIQVPDASHAPNPVLIPTLAELPLIKPANIPDSELAGLITTARAAYPSHDIDPNTPILAIDRSAAIPTNFQIQIGQVASPNAAQGVTLTIQHLNRYYQVTPETTPWPEPTSPQNP